MPAREPSPSGAHPSGAARSRTGRVTLRDLAEDTGLSVAAVSYALRGLQVPPETQSRVRDAAERLGYQADPIARALASGRTGHVGILGRSLTDPWQQDLVVAVARGLLDHGLFALIVDSCDDPHLEQTLAAGLVDRRVDALVVLPVDPTAEHWAALADRTALVSVGDALPRVRTAAEVVFDNRAAVDEALGLLCSHGHRHIAVLTPGGVDTPDRPVERVVQEHASRRGMDIRLHTSGSDVAGAAAVAGELLAGPEAPTAFFCLADSMAYGVYAAARAAGLSIPDDVSVIGSDDNAVSALLTPALSAYRWPVDALVAAVVDRTAKAATGGGGSRRKVVTATMQERGSVGRPRSGRAPAGRSREGRKRGTR